MLIPKYRTRRTRTRSLYVALGGLLALHGFTTPLRADLYITDSNGVSRYNSITQTLDVDFISLPDATGVTFGPDGNLYVATTTGTDSDPGSEVFRYNPVTGAQVGAGPFVVYNGQPPTPDPRDVIIPQGMKFGSDGRLYIADVSGSTSNVHIYTSAGVSVGALSDPGLDSPTSVAFDKQGQLYVTAAGTVLKYSFTTSSFNNFIDPASASPTDPFDLTFGPDGELYVLDGSNSSSGVFAYNSAGVLDRTVVDFSTSSFFPTAIAVGADGQLYISGADSTLPTPEGEVLRYSPTGTPEGIAVSGLPNDADFIAFSPTPEPSAWNLMLFSGAGMMLVSFRPRRLTEKS